MSKATINSCNLVNIIQRITVYETFHSFYIVGSSDTEKTFKVVKIDRTCHPKTLAFSEDLHEYDEDEIKELLSMVNIDISPTPSLNKPSSPSKGGILRTYHAYGIIGFIRFFEGYYMILLTKQLPVAVLGYHTIYTIEDVLMVYIPYIEKQPKEVNNDEKQYLKLFQLIDMRQNFYYSYTYDLTNTFQQNLTEVKKMNEAVDDKIYGLINKPCAKFLWNEFLMKPVTPKLSYPWRINLIHGFLGQSSLNIYGCNILVTLIARRSQKFAGTRFLKRGGTNEGYVANEVETEQIVHNASVSSFTKGNYTSFVHTRGSIPLFWSQDPKAVPKPPITIDIVDPFATVAARHFKQLINRFGAPLIILNLVKIREKKPQESIISNEFKLSLDYLKQFLPNQNYIEYICLDMSKLNKNPKANVMNRLYEIAERCVEKVGFFQTFPEFYANREFDDDDDETDSIRFVRQKGIVRTNCVDCLDRTNTAMYVIGKCAMAHQLHALGILSSPNLGQESICERMLIDLYEKCGDAIAQQYAGSQLVHRVDTYGKNTLASQSRDMMHTISRYYSNAFTDAEKQCGINLLLGYFEPSKSIGINLWDLQTDCYLHDHYIMQPWKIPKNYIDWIDSKTFGCLPAATDQEFKSLASFAYVEKVKEKSEPRVNSFDNFYKPFELTAFHEIFYFSNLTTNRKTNTNTIGFGGNIKAILDPFKMMRSTKTEAAKNAKDQKEMGNSSGEEEDDDDSFELVPEVPFKNHFSQENIRKSDKFTGKIKSSINYVITEVSMNIYKKYVDNENKLEKSSYDYLKKDASWSDFSIYSNITLPESRKKSSTADQFFKIKFDEQSANPATLLKSETKKFYEDFLYIGLNGAQQPSESNIKLYESHARHLQFSL